MDAHRALALGTSVPICLAACASPALENEPELHPDVEAIAPGAPFAPGQRRDVGDADGRWRAAPRPEGAVCCNAACGVCAFPDECVDRGCPGD